MLTLRTDVGCPGTARQDRRASGYTEQQLTNWFLVCQRPAVAPSKLLNPWTAMKLECNKNHLLSLPCLSSWLLDLGASSLAGEQNPGKPGTGREWPADMEAQAKEKKDTKTFFVVCLQFAQRAGHFGCEFKLDIAVCLASGCFNVGWALVTQNGQTLKVRRRGGEMGAVPTGPPLTLACRKHSNERKACFFNRVVFQEQEIHRKTFPHCFE